MRQTEANRVYQDFEPAHEWDKYNGCFTVTLPGKRYFSFERKNLRIL